MRILAAFLTAFALAMAPMEAPLAQKGARLVRVTYSQGWDALPAIVGLERGFFAEQGLIVSGMPVSNSVAAVESLVAGTSDFALLPQRTMLVMAASKLDFTVISMNGWGAEMELIVPNADSRSKGLADLKGKRIALTPGSEALPVLMRLINRAGLGATDLKIFELGADRLANALKDGSADAVIELRQLTSAVVRSGEGRVLISNDDITKSIGRIGAAPLVVNNTVLKDEATTVQRFLNGWLKALSYIRQDPEDAAILLRIFFHRQGVKIAEDLAESWVRMIRYDRYTWSESDIADAEYNGWGLKEGKILKVQPKLDGHIRNDLAEQAAKAVF